MFSPYCRLGRVPFLNLATGAEQWMSASVSSFGSERDYIVNTAAYRKPQPLPFVFMSSTSVRFSMEAATNRIIWPWLARTAIGTKDQTCRPSIPRAAMLWHFSIHVPMFGASISQSVITKFTVSRQPVALREACFDSIRVIALRSVARSPGKVSGNPASSKR